MIKIILNGILQYSAVNSVVSRPGVWIEETANGRHPNRTRRIYTRPETKGKNYDDIINNIQY